jgi:hypothetical protein
MLLNEIVDGGKIVYHGAMKEFDTPDLSLSGSESGSEKGGWGFYVSESPEVAKQYTPVGNPVIMKYTLPNGKYFDLDEAFSIHEGEKIQNWLDSMRIDENEMEEFSIEFMSGEYESTNGDVYTWLSHVLESSKNASLFLHDHLGYIGNTFKDKTDRSVSNYVLFDVSRLKRIPDEDY